MSLSSEELEAIVAVVEHGSFRSAATKLHKAQSSISYLIKNLEEKLKIKIFTRKGNSSVLTEAGKIIYNKALVVQKVNQEIFEFSKLLKDGIENKITLAISAVTPTQFLTDILKDFNDRFPQTQLELSFKTFEEPLEVLLKGDADLAISHTKTEKESLEKIKWNLIDFMPVASPIHPASSKLITEEDLFNMTNLVVGGRKTLARGNQKDFSQNTNVWNITDFLIKKELLTCGLGWGFMPKQLIERELREGLLVKVPAKASKLKQLHLIRKRSEFIGPAARYLWKLFMDNAGRSIVSQGKSDWTSASPSI